MSNVLSLSRLAHGLARSDRRLMKVMDALNGEYGSYSSAASSGRRDRPAEGICNNFLRLAPR
ncbi:hypothetical protein [Nitrosospira sp. Nsp1]|uniref:hypothetical protein n=1 Tax=Nitrosospira sp. Nsp1 TaxID=136547 RepID=UPI000B809028|nr:hypothetical protein [Nitrosospira sp. Nsp1]